MKSETLVFAASAARSGTTPLVSPIFDLSAYNHLALSLLLSGLAGTSPTLDCLVEDSVDGTTFHTHTAFTQLTANGKAIRRLSALARYVRVTTTFGGTTPSGTYEVLAHAKESL